MWTYSHRDEKLTFSTGGYSQEGVPIQDVLVAKPSGILYEPVTRGERSKIAVLAMHPTSDYSTLSLLGELAKRGYTAFGARVMDPNSSLDRKMIEIGRCISFLRKYPGVEKVVLLAHSGGATMMTAYQAVAENSPEIFRGDHMLFSCEVQESLTPADGILILDSNWGNSVMTLISVDPAVIEEGNGCDLDPEFDSSNPDVGYDPAGSHYTAAFKKKFLAAQRERNNRIVEDLLNRAHAISEGKGRLLDDEPISLVGFSQMGPCNKLITSDTGLLAHTVGEWPLLHSDGSISTEIVHSVRPAQEVHSLTPTTWGMVSTTVRAFLSEHAIIAGDDYDILEDRITGIQWENTYNSPLGNVRYIHVPTLVMGMTGGVEYLASETIYQNSPSTDKSLAFVEGASHRFTTEKAGEKYPGQFGDTQKTLCDYVAKWLSETGRFL